MTAFEQEPLFEVEEVPRSEVSASPPRDELDRLDPIGSRFSLSSGSEIEIMPLKLRQFLKFLRILTAGASDVWGTMRLSTDDEGQFLAGLMGLAVFAIPQAEDETVDFLKSMVQPADLPKGPDRASQNIRMERWNALSLELENPELEDTINLLQAILEAEASDLMALGKRLRRMFMSVRQMWDVNSLPTAS